MVRPLTDGEIRRQLDAMGETTKWPDAALIDAVAENNLEPTAARDEMRETVRRVRVEQITNSVGG